MNEEKKEVSEEKSETETQETEKKEEEKTEETKDEFEEKEEVVPVGKYNQTIRKLREKELEERELKKQLEDVKKTIPKKEESEDDEEEEDVFKEKLPDINHLIDEKVKPVLERLNKKEESDRKNQRDAFFTAHPEYLDAKKWNELLDEMDNSLNPNSKDNHYTQLEKAHRIISGDNSEISKKKNEMASESASKGDGSNKVDGRKSSEDDRADRLSKRMPIGYEFKI